MTTTLTLDAALASAEYLARDVLLEAVEADVVGDHLGVEMEAPLLATHLFACLNPGYVNWRWAVTVTRLPDSTDVTVCESVLIPGEGALAAPEWVPWEDRVQAGDLGAGDVLPTPPDDIRLVPGYSGADADTTSDDDLRPLEWELGLGRIRVLSVTGRDEAAQRWIAGDTGPKSPVARAANDRCSTCGFLVPMSGPLGRAFGLCANEFSPADGRVVAMTHGCGAHSEVELAPLPVTVVDLVVDDHSPDMLDTEDIAHDPGELAAEAANDEGGAERADDSPAASADSTDAESDGEHSTESASNSVAEVAMDAAESTPSDTEELSTVQQSEENE